MVLEGWMGVGFPSVKSLWSRLSGRMTTALPHSLSATDEEETNVSLGRFKPSALSIIYKQDLTSSRHDIRNFVCQQHHPH